MRHSVLIGITICAIGWIINSRGYTQEKDASSGDKPAATATEEKQATETKDSEATDAEQNGDAKAEEAKEDRTKIEATKKDAEKNGEAKKDADKKEADKKEADEKKANKLVLASLTLESSYPEGPGQAGIFGELELNLHKVVERLDKIAKDDKVVGVILKLRNPDIGRGKIDELRAAISRVRKAGKKVYADIEMTMSNEYMLACACDEIIMPPSGMLSIPGVRFEMTYFKELLDKLGVQAEMMQVGDYKGAAEPVTRTEMSPEFRKQIESLVDDYYEQMVNSISEDRKLDKAKVKELIDHAIFTPERAKKEKLIDRVGYEDEIRDQLKQQLKADELSIVKDYGKPEIDTDFSGITGMMKFMELIMGGGQSARASKNKKVAIIYAVGMIVPGESSSGLFAEVLGSETIVKALRKAEEDKNVVAIVLRVDSPGGSALASDLIWREVTRIEKPIVASMGDTAASGGYYISMGADRIFAEPGTLTGSIGVVGGKMSVRGLMNKVGVNPQVVARGQNSGWLSMTEPFSESERKAWKEMMTEIYEQFTTKAAKGRSMEVARLQELAQGKLYSGRMALEVKLVDELGTLDDAVAEAKKLGGLKAEEKAELLILPEPKNFFEELFGGPSLESRVRAAVPEVADQLGELGAIRKLFAEPAAATVMPFQVKIK